MAAKEPEGRQEAAPHPEEKPESGESPEESAEEGESKESGGLSIVGALREALSGRSSPLDTESPAEETGREPDQPRDAAGEGPGESDSPPAGGWLRRKFALRRSLRVQIATGLGAAILFTLIASIIALVAFFQVGRIQREINLEYVPALTRAVQIGQLATDLAGAAPRLVAEARNRQLAADPAEEEVAEEPTASTDLLESAARIIELSSELAVSERTAGLRTFSADLAGNLQGIQVSVESGVVLQERLSLLQEQTAVRSRDLNELIGPLLDDQVFYLATGLRDLEDEPAPIEIRGAETEVIYLQALSAIDARGNLAGSLISDVVVQDDLELVETLEERFRAATAGTFRALDTLGDRTPRQLRETLQAIYELGLGAEGAFPTRRQYLAELRNQLAYLARNESITNSLEAAVGNLTVGLEVDAIAATEESEAALNLGRSLLVALNVLGISSAALILWLFVGRFLIARLTALSRAMRRMAGGDLETRIEVRGQDEVGQMAQALEVFRQHALEVQRLNLVEELATRVEAQNEELAKTLEDLEKAQDQMVMQEKLASLGQLTAGIAHEIKNPLNFVNNFADVSSELLEDLKEELETVKENVPEESIAEIEDISADLSGNLERIVHHGKRASSIVYGMLEHARKEGGERRPTEINAMLEEYIALAFHSMRAVDSRFQMTIEKSFAEDVGAIEAVPQDLSRVFLNIVTNACQATFEKQLAETTDAGYTPELSVSSRKDKELIEVRIKDNGPGIPESHLSKIFEPFFTTKDTDKGTGLGLSLCHDIVRGHGGTLAVNSEVGEGAEFVITLPAASTPSGAGTGP
jgi:signal transduction histidine kinase